MMTHKISLYIPSTVDGNKPASRAMVQKWVSAAKNTFATLFGGFTAIPVQGGYISPEKGLIEENITIVYAFTDADGLKHKALVKALAKRIAKAMKQESVSVEVDNAIEFIAA